MVLTGGGGKGAMVTKLTIQNSIDIQANISVLNPPRNSVHGLKNGYNSQERKSAGKVFGFLEDSPSISGRGSPRRRCRSAGFQHCMPSPGRGCFQVGDRADEPFA